MSEFYNKLSKVQEELKVLKSEYNQFGKYKYRNVENIYNQAKPLCVKYGLTLTVSDSLVYESGRFYIKATATVTDGNTAVSSDGFAREDEDKKGMDKAQLTGACSSYARKYALSGLFLLDDNQDIDSMDNDNTKSEKKGKPEKYKKEEKTDIGKMLYAFSELGIHEEDLLILLDRDNLDNLSDKEIKQLKDYYKQVKTTGEVAHA